MFSLNSKQTQTTITTIPSQVAPQAVIKLIHDHKRLAGFSPKEPTVAEIEPDGNLLSKLQQIPLKLANRRDDQRKEPPWHPGQEQVAALKMTEHIPYYGEMTYQTIFRDFDNGTDHAVQAPLGVNLTGTWSVVPEESIDCDANVQMVLREDTLVECNALLMPFVMMNFQDAHQQMHKRIIEAAAQG